MTAIIHTHYTPCRREGYGGGGVKKPVVTNPSLGIPAVGSPRKTSSEIMKKFWHHGQLSISPDHGRPPGRTLRTGPGGTFNHAFEDDVHDGAGSGDGRWQTRGEKDKDTRHLRLNPDNSDPGFREGF